MNRKDERRVAKVEGTRVAVLIFIILILTPLIALPGELQKVIKFSSSDLHFSKFNDYTIVKLKGALSTNEVGSPALPSYPVRILIPCEATATKVEVISCEREKLAGKYFIIPAQPPRPISFNRAVEFSKPNPKVYNSPTPYPGKLLELTGTGSKEGYRIANVIIYPLQYSPSLRVLEFYHSITFKITYEEENHETMALSPKQKEVVEKSIRQLVINPEDITLFAPPVKLSPIGFKVLEPNDVEYCIITSATLAPEFERLANWKTKKGIPAQIVTTDWIYSHYFGNDDQAKIRNFIIDANETWGTIWFLLGGDVGIIPARKTYLFHVEGYPLELDTIPCDLYYSDLDGSWDVNGNGVYGELDDYVDLYSDVYVGRASVSTVTECATFVNKVLTYEKNPPLGFIEKILLVAKKLYDQPEYWGDVISDSIAAIVPYEWEDVKLYQSLGNLSKKAVMDSLNQGFGFCHWAAHGHFDRISDILLNYDAAKLNNGDKLGIHNSIACFNAAFDYSYCIAEYLMNNSNGGAIAFIGNSRYGWATPPVIGPSEKLDLEFYRTLTDRGIYNIGQTYGFTKDLFVPIASSDVFMLWCIQNLILLGDPEMPIWTSEPKFLDVTHPSTISMGSYNFNVECRSVGEPVSNVFVCLMKANEVYATGVTNLNGEVTLNVVPASSGTLYVTCTVDNFYPYEGICTVIAAGPYVRYVYHEIDDSIGGNNNGYVDNGESVKLSITLENTGDVPVIDVYGVLRVNDPYVTALSDTIQGYGDIMPGDSATSNGSYSFSISASTPDAHLIHFELEITDTGNVWIDTVSVLVRAPHIVYYTYNIDDTDGIDPNGYLDVGETASLILGLWNRGMGDATGVNAKIHTNDTYITISDSIADFGDIPSSNTADNSDNPYVVTVANDAPIGHIVEFNLYVNVVDGLIDTSTFYIYIGGPGLLYGDHDIGNVTFTVTCQGICGFASQDQLQGNGFIYPKGGENLLCIGSIWMGNSKDYVVNRDYGRDADWVVTWEPNGKLRLGRKEYSDQDGWAMYSDEGHPNPNHIVVTQRSWAWKGSPYDDFVIISYMLKNNGLAPINSLYVGQFMDFDMIDPYNNMMGTDTTRRLVYEWYQDSIYVGVKLLDPTIAANLSGINNPEYVWPYAHTPDSIKIKFLKGYLSFPSAYADTDWSIIVSAGPFDLEVNDSVRVAFAILGGDNLLDLKANADRAQEKYDALQAAPDIRVSTMSFSNILSIDETNTDTLIIYNDGQRDLTWNILENPPVSWLSEEDTSGVVSARDSQIVILTFDASGLSHGTYNTALVITSNDTDESTIDVNVTLTVHAPSIWVDPDSFSVTLTEGKDTTVSLTIGNSGNTTLIFSISENPLVDWLSESSVSNSVSPDSQVGITLNFSTDELLPGTYNTILNITSNAPDQGTVNVPVQLTIARDLIVYPNPFGSSGVKFIYYLTRKSEVTIKIYTISGELIRTISGTAAPGTKGNNISLWDAKNEHGKEVPPGIYIYHVLAKDNEGNVMSKVGKCAKSK